ncbi:MAG: DUF1684 domain-containing protein [Bacteroidales bacterium]|nr:DUF1684 domain-containing protein [Bacteroidales bacterium]MCF8386849.1 DUF1684 domain-containing protein [Bacteroidales bacterium]MCF8399267.1 DUF1684 domain-containing protein [Bacteroidales bacterium]
MSIIRFTKERKGRRLTWFARFIILAIIVFVFFMLLKQLNAYLCISKPLASNTLVVEGWLPDYSLQEMMDFVQSNKVQTIILTGVPIERGYYLTEYKTYADIAIASLAAMGYDTSGIIKINLPRNILRDRTYTTALALKEEIGAGKLKIKDFNIFTLGCHARRSYLLFKTAFKDDLSIGVISAKDESYNYNQWMQSSRGFRTVLNEGIACLYASLFFDPNDKKLYRKIREGYYYDSVEKYRSNKNIEFQDTSTSPLKKDQIELFKTLNYFAPDMDFRVKASFTIDTSGEAFKMKTTTDRLPSYRNYAKLQFRLGDKLFRLSAYQNMAFIDHPEYHNYLFLPMRDMSSGEETYGGGRYLDLIIPRGDSIILDFNFLYNPYCSYNDRYSCPIPPAENYVGTKILAGEKPYDYKH